MVQNQNNSSKLMIIFGEYPVLLNQIVPCRNLLYVIQGEYGHLNCHTKTFAYITLFSSLLDSPSGSKHSRFQGFHHIQTYDNLQNSSERVIGPSYTTLPENTQHSQQIDIHVSRGIRTRNPINRAAADRRLRPRGHWDQLVYYVRFHILLTRYPCYANNISCQYPTEVRSVVYTYGK